MLRSSFALGGAVASRDRVVVETILLDHVAAVRGIEHERLCRALDELGFVDDYLARPTRSRTGGSRAEAAEKLGLAGAKRATAQLAAALDDEVPEVRLRAAKSLGLVGGRAAVLPLVKALTEPNRWSTIRIADILTGMKGEVVEELMDAVPELNAHAKLAALDILGGFTRCPRCRGSSAPGRSRRRRARRARRTRSGAIGVVDAAPALRKALDDPEWPVRAMAAKALGPHPRPRRDPGAVRRAPRPRVVGARERRRGPEARGTGRASRRWSGCSRTPISSRGIRRARCSRSRDPRSPRRELASPAEPVAATVDGSRASCDAGQIEPPARARKRATPTRRCATSLSRLLPPEDARRERSP